MQHDKKTITDSLIQKYNLKHSVFQHSQNAFVTLKECVKELVRDNKQKVNNEAFDMPFDYRDKNEFHMEFTFGSDVLVFMLHSNIFEFDRNHEVRKTSYIKEDITRSYCGNIRIYNFLSDSFKYNRMNDVGYLIGRIFINKENHYFIEGKREVGMLYNNFASAELDKDAIERIILSSMDYCINFDLLNPPFENMKEAMLGEMTEYSNNMSSKTGKRLGFRFNADQMQL